TDEDAVTYYEEKKERFKKPEQRQAAHILINDDDEAKETLATIQSRLDAGDSFADLAKEFSQDAGSADQGGELGLVASCEMVEAFDEALFSIQAGTVSEPVKSEFGYHIIKLEAINEAQIPDFESVKSDIIQDLQAKQAQTLFLDRANELSGLVLDSQSGLQQAAEATDLTVKTTDFFARSGGVDIAANPEFVKMAYSSLVKDDLLNSDVVNLSDTHIAFIHMNEINPAALKPRSEVSEGIKDQLATEKSAQQAKQLAESILEQAKQTDWSELADENDLTVVEARDVKRTGSNHPFTVVKEV